MTFRSENGFPTDVQIIEVGPRDGLQREAMLIPTDEKIALINALADARLDRIQITSFVHPRRVPQMADAEAVCAKLTRRDGVVYSGLALNLKGVERARMAGIEHIDISVSASDAHSQRNANRTVAEALEEFNQMYDLARAAGMVVRGGIQCAFGYLHEKDVHPDTVLELAQHHVKLGVDELALADSAGLANPRQISELLSDLLPLAGDIPIILHLHDTRGMGLANVLAALRAGVRRFDTAFGGLGGCPFITDATGNIATEDTVHMLHEMGIQTGVDLARLSRITQNIEALLGKGPLPGKLYRLHQTAKHRT